MRFWLIRPISFIVLTVLALSSLHPVICYAAPSYGTAVQLHTGGNAASLVVTRALDATHFVTIYADDANSSYGTAVYGTVTDGVFSYSTETVFNAGTTYEPFVTVIDATHFIVVYLNSSYRGKAKIGTVSNGTISFGSEFEFESGMVAGELSAKKLDDTHIIIAYSAYTTDYIGRAIVGTISGANLSFGTAATFNSGWVYYGPSIAVLDATHFILTYSERSGSNYYGRMLQGTVSGTSLSFGSESNFSDSTTVYFQREASEALDSTHVAVSYRDPFKDNNSIRSFVITKSDATLTAGTSVMMPGYITPNITRGISVARVDDTHFVTAFGEQSSNNAQSFFATVSGGSTVAFGAQTIFDAAGNSVDISATVLDATHVVVGYRDADNGNRVTHVLGTISGTSISYGAESTMDTNTGWVGSVSVGALDTTHGIVAFSDSAYYGYAAVATVSGTTTSLGSLYPFNAATTSYVDVVMLDSTHFVAAYRDSDTYGRAIVGTVSGTAISYGSEYAFNSAATLYVSITPLDSTHFVVAYKDSDNQGRAVVGTISGTTISYGSEYVFNAATTNYVTVTALDSTHFVAAYQDSDNYGRAIVGTVSGTTISYGSEYAFNSATTTYVSAIALDATHVAIGYKDSDNYGRAIIGTISGTAISYGSEYAFNAASTSAVSLDKLSSTQLIASYSDTGNASYGTSAIGTVAGTVITFDAESVSVAAATSLNAIAALTNSSFLVGYRNDTLSAGAIIAGSFDATPPAPSGFSPASASTIADATQAIIFTTDENATCRLSLDGDEAYADMSDDVSCTGGGTTSQSCTTPDLGSDGAKTVYIACTDGTNADTADTNEALAYTLDTVSPIPSSFSPASSTTITDSTPTITFSLNENGNCRASVTDESYDQMSENDDCTGDGSTSISCTISDLGSDGAKTVYIACTDGTNADTADTNEALAYTLDTTAPNFTTLSTTPADTSVVIAWDTNEMASTQVEYGSTISYGLLTAETNTSPRVLAHSVTLTGLPVCTTFSFRLIGRDAAGNVAYGSEWMFTTTHCTNEATVGDQQRDSVTASGGTVTLTGGETEVTVTAPEDEDRGAVTIQIKKIDTTTVMTDDVEAAKPSGQAIIGDHTYDIKAIDGTELVTEFVQPITIVMQYTDEQVSAYVESSLQIYRWGGLQWDALESCAVDTAAHTVTCTTMHFSTFGLFGVPITTSTTENDTTTTTSASGRRPETIAQRVAVAQQTLLTNFRASHTQQSTLTPSERQHAARADAVGGEEHEEAAPLPQERGYLVASVRSTTVVYRDVPISDWYAPTLHRSSIRGLLQATVMPQETPRGSLVSAIP